MAVLWDSSEIVVLVLGKFISHWEDLQVRQLRLKPLLCLSRISETNFSSGTGPAIPVSVPLLLKFGGHLTTKTGTTWLVLTKKGLMRILCGA
jgi:hypothetical protein